HPACFASVPRPGSTPGPVLAWQNANGETSGIVGVAADVNEGKAEYFNLQGIRVNNPENGIYIVRRAGKVTKEYIR
ncbi:MAG: hypothetical protein K2I89_07735, partial [Muribaculaceae bacterium]|nr:hypothetical protein [Muribaculaceae bacterium]